MFQNRVEYNFLSYGSTGKENNFGLNCNSKPVEIWPHPHTKLPLASLKHSDLFSWGFTKHPACTLLPLACLYHLHSAGELGVWDQAARTGSGVTFPGPGFQLICSVALWSWTSSLTFLATSVLSVYKMSNNICHTGVKMKWVCSCKI